MQKRFSEMSREELLQESERLLKENERLYKEGRMSEANIAKQKYYFCLSYLKDPKEIESGKVYQIQGEKDTFLVEYLNGVMAWGYRNGDTSQELDALPIGQLMEENKTNSSHCGCSDDMA